MILLGDPQRMSGEMHAADALLAKKNCSPQELLERIKVMCARKRGPRKGAPRMVHTVELAMAS
jgi:DNA-binding response OmpR family regulator